MLIIIIIIIIIVIIIMLVIKRWHLEVNTCYWLKTILSPNNSTAIFLFWSLKCLFLIVSVHSWWPHSQNFRLFMESKWTMGTLQCVWRQYYASVADGKCQEIMKNKTGISHFLGHHLGYVVNGKVFPSRKALI